MPAEFSPHQKLELADFPIKESTKKAFDRLLRENDSIVSKHTNDINTTPLIRMDIETEGPPVASRPYVLPLKHYSFVQREVENLERAGVIRKSLSPYASPIVVVSKKASPGAPEHETKRLCIDYRKLNQQLPLVQKGDSKAKGVISLIPLPKIDELLGRLKGAKVFSAIDLRQGYHHIAINEESIPKTAFTTPYGKWEFLKCPFGLNQAPAYFMALINRVLEGTGSFAMGYMDDILVFSPDEETHLKHLKLIFTRLKKARLKIKLSKCSFFKKNLHYLGHLISADGILPMEDKLAAIRDLAPPTNVHEVQQVMGLLNYYRKFVPNYTEIAKNITELVKKGTAFEWTEKRQASFNELKKGLTEAPVLVYPDPNQEYFLFTDAAKYSWSAILTQAKTTKLSSGEEVTQYHPVAFQSGTFRGSQLNWPALTKEAYAIYMAFKKLSYYLEGCKTVLRCDHAPLKKFIEGKTDNPKVNNWGIALQNFQIEFQHIKGKDNIMADALSRLKRLGLYEAQDPEPEGFEFGHSILEQLPSVKVQQVEVIQTQSQVEPIPVQNCDLSNIQKHQDSDKFCSQVKRNIRSAKFQEYKVEDEVLYRKTKVRDQIFDTVVVPGKLQQHILHAAHENLGHMGINKTYSFLRKKYYWLGMKKHITHHIRSCEQCSKENLRPPPYIPGTLKVVNQPMYHLYMDLIGPFPTSEKNNTYCLTACCAFSDFLFCFPIPNKEAETVIQAYLKNIYAWFGGSKVIITDNGTEFKNALFKKVCDELDMIHHTITAYLPSSNLVERHHSALKKCIAKFCKRDASRWDEIVPFACMVQNMFPHTLEGESAFFKLRAADPIVLHMESLLQPKRRYLGDQNSFIDLEALYTFQMQVAARLEKARQKEKKDFASNTVLPKVGDAVLFKNHNKTGFAANFLSGYRVVKKINDSNYVIKNSVTGKTSQVHVRDLIVSPMIRQVLNTFPPEATFGRTGKFANCPQVALRD